MVNWSDLIDTNKKVVVKFATGCLSGEDFQREFSGNPNPARCAVRDHGVTYARRLARKALRRRGLIA
jgi:hypothetical protein